MSYNGETMNFKKIELSDMALIKKYYTPEKCVGAHQSFTNMYIWQESYNISFAEEDGFLFIKSRHSHDCSYYIFPCGEGDKKAAVEKIIADSHIGGCKCVFAHLSPEESLFLKENFGDTFSFRNDRDNAEYVYETDSLINLSGKKLHGKRNHLNTFLNSYKWEYKEIMPENIDEARQFCIKSITERDQHDEELSAMQKLFDGFFALGLSGAMLYANGNLCAVTAGEMLSCHTAVIHLEKADTQVKGSYAAINNLFAKNRFGNTKFINREEDMGIEGLRRAKESYRPCHMVEKWVAVEK